MVLDTPLRDSITYRYRFQTPLYLSGGFLGLGEKARVRQAVAQGGELVNQGVALRRPRPSAGDLLSRLNRAYLFGSGRLSGGVLVAVGALMLFGLGFARVDSAGAELLTLGSFADETGESAGKVGFGTGVAINRAGVGGANPGDAYVADFQNARVDQFTAEGEFIRAFGWDVVASGEHNTGGFEVCQAQSSPQDVCKAGSKVASAGSLSNVEAIAVDPHTGNVFVADNGNAATNSGKRISVYSATGQFEGAFGIGVDSGAASLEFCTVVSQCQAGAASVAAGGFSNLVKAALAVDPDTGNLYVGERGALRISEFSFTLNGSDEVTDVAFVRAYGWDVIPGGATELETCTIATTCKAGVAGAGDGQFLANTPTGIAVDSGGFVYAVTSPGVDAASGACSAVTPCRVQKFNPDGTFAGVFGPSSGGADSCQLNWTAGVANTEAAAAIAVDAATDHVYVTRKASSSGTTAQSPATFELCEFDSTGNLIDRSPATPLTTNNTGYLHPAIGTGTIYINAPIEGQRGAIFVLGEAPAAPSAEIVSVEDIGANEATARGRITIQPPGGLGYRTSYQFEVSSNGVVWTPVSSSPIALGSIAGEYDVEARVTGLEPNSSYVVRLSAISTETTRSEPVQIETEAEAPSILVMRPEDVTQTTATVAAQIDANGMPTSYHVEWAPEGGGAFRRLPGFERHIGQGNAGVYVQEELAGLEPASGYIWHIVARNDAGTSVSPEQSFETLNSCGLINGRCPELVSPDKGPVAGAGDAAGTGLELPFQVGGTGTQVAFRAAYGFPDSTAGGDVLYRAQRSVTGWSRSQITPPALAATTTKSDGAQVALTLGLSSDLSCAIQSSAQPLSADAPQATVDAGYTNLFLRDDAGLYLPITNKVPTNLMSAPLVIPRLEYTLLGVSADCGTVLFSTRFQYSGLPGAGTERLYLWHRADRVLRSLSSVPGPGGSISVATTAGASDGTNAWKALASDGQQVVFSALRQLGDGPAGATEVGKQAVFVQDEGDVVDVSRSATNTPDLGANYVTASDDGQRVFFLANYGLTGSVPSAWPTSCAVSTGSGCDLYEYNFARPDEQRLVSLTGNAGSGNPAGPAVVAAAGTSRDGAVVYFAARGQLVPGEGRDQLENSSANSYNVYVHSGDQLRYVATVSREDVERMRIQTNEGRSWTARVSESGNYFAFEATANVTGLEPAGVQQAYLYEADAGETTCVSCHISGEAPLADGNAPLTNGRLAANGQALLAKPLQLTGDGRLFFVKRDQLATGAKAGQQNLYEWDHGQIAFIASSRQGFITGLRFVGASADGIDAYVATMDPLNWEDEDSQLDIYDMRSGGGFPQPPSPGRPCQPLIEGDCRDSAARSPSPGTSPGSMSPQPGGNVKEQTHKCRRGQVRRGERCVKRQKGKPKRQKGKPTRGKRRKAKGRHPRLDGRRQDDRARQHAMGDKKLQVRL